MISFKQSGQRQSLQTHHMDSTLKRRGNDRFHVVSTWNLRGVFVGWKVLVLILVPSPRTRTNVGLIIIKTVTSLSCHMVNFAFKKTNKPGWKSVIEKAWFT